MTMFILMNAWMNAAVMSNRPIFRGISPITPARLAARLMIRRMAANGGVPACTSSRTS